MKDNVLKTIVLSILSLVAAAFIIYGWFVPTTDEATLYNALHTGSPVANVLGTIFVLGGAAALSGLLPVERWINGSRPQEREELSPNTVKWMVAILIAIGFLLTLA
jgi:hypothetical protein